MSWSRLRMLIVLPMVLFSLSGCWDKIEVRELSIVIGIGLDYVESNKQIRLVVQTVKPGGDQSSDGKGGGGDSRFLTLVSQGRTVYDAFNNLHKSSPKTIIFPHSKIIVLGKQFAEKGISEISDYLLREREIRQNSWIIVADSTAKEALEAKMKTSPLPAAGLVTMLENLKDTSLAHPINLTQFYMRMQNQSRSTAIPFLSIHDETAEFEQTAVFHRDQMIGFLNVRETSGLLWLENKLRKGNINIVLENENSELVKNISVDIRKGYTRITPRFVSPSNITMDIECTGVGTIREAEAAGMTLSDPKTIELLKEKTESVLQKRVRNTIEKAQKELKTDFIGFEDKFHNKYPVGWNKLKGEWEQIFPTIQTNVRIQIDIERQGIIKNPPQL